ncbi:hypothetical protein GBA52_014007 [Prunus armeniaca]|nr:hypothetical protein GBA52_014007 [Prunus armeniaca]
MAPTQEEELKLRLFNGQLSQLGPAERFLKALIEIPFAFKRLKHYFLCALFRRRSPPLRSPFATLEEIIRSEGVRAARAAKREQEFSSIKSDDLLEETSQETEEHFRSLGLQKVSGLSNELENVKKRLLWMLKT